MIPYAHARQLAFIMRCCVGACHVWLAIRTPGPRSRCACGKYAYADKVVTH